MESVKEKTIDNITNDLDYIEAFIKGSDRDLIFEDFFGELRTTLSSAWFIAAQEIIHKISLLKRADREKIIQTADETFTKAGQGKYSAMLNFGFTTYKSSVLLHEKHFRFNEFDRELSNSATYEPFVWFHQYYSKRVRTAMINEIKESAIQREDISKLKDRLKGLFTDYDLAPIKMHPETYWELVARNTTTRLRNIAGAATMIRMGVTAYRIVAVMDKRTTPFCQAMNGKIIPISTAYDWLDKWLSMDSPTQVKEKLPFANPNDPSPVQGLSGDEIPAVYALPPYHHFCRTTYVTVDRPLKIEYALKSNKTPLDEEIVALRYLIGIRRLTLSMAEKILKSHPLYKRANERVKKQSMKTLKGGSTM